MSAPLLQVKNLVKHFPVRGPLQMSQVQPAPQSAD